MADFELNAKLQPDVKNALSSYLRRKEGIINIKLRRKLKESAEFLKERIASYAPKVSGNLQQIIRSLPVKVSGMNFSFTKSGTIRINIPLNRRKDLKILWVDRGTGIYGPFRRRIRPTIKPLLVFEINGRIIRTRSVKGQKGQRFIQRVLNSSKLIIGTKIKSALKG